MTPEEKAAQEALLQKIKDNTKQEIETRGYQNKEAVQSILDSTLKDLPLDALRTYETEKEKLNDSLRNIAGELEKVKNVRAGEVAVNKHTVRDLVQRAFTGKDGGVSDVELLMREKDHATKPKEIRLNIRAAATMTNDNVINEGAYPYDMIESMNVLDGVVKKRRGTQYITDFASVQTFAEIDEYTTWMEEGNEQGAFAIVAEGAVKPLVSYDLVRNTAKAKKVAAKYVVTEEFTKFKKRAFAIIQNLIQDKIQRDYAAILTLDLQAQAAQYVGTSLDHTKTAPTDFDAIAAVAAQIETLNFFPDLLIIHPQDKWRIAMETDSQGRYYFMIPTVGPDGVISLMGFRVLTSTYQPIGTATLGESGLFKIEQETLTVRMGFGIDVTTAVVSGQTVVTAVASDFDTNKMRIIVENYFKDYIATSNIGSFVTFTFNAVKQALTKTA